MFDVFLIHFIKPELDWLSTTLSWYAVGDSGYIIAAGFCFFAGAEIACSALLVLTARRSNFYGPLFFSVAGIGALLATLFPVQPLTVEFVTRLPHITGAIMQFLFFPLALFGIKNYITDGRFKYYTRLTASITLVFFVVLLSMLFLRSEVEFSFFGLLQKIDIFLITSWVIVFSFISIHANTFKE